MRLQKTGFQALAIAAAIAILPATASAQDSDTICQADTHPNRLESVLCNWSEAAGDQPFEAYAIRRSYSLIGPLERYVMLTKFDGEWHLQAVGFQRDYDGQKSIKQTYTMILEDVSDAEAAKMTSRFSDTAWTAIEDTFPKDIDQVCLDGSALTAYRYNEGTFEALSQHDCYGQSGLTDLADEMAKHVIAQEPDITPFIDGLLK